MKISLIVPAAIVPLFFSSPSIAQSPPAAPAVTAVDIDTLTALSGAWSYRSYAGGSEAAFADSSGVRRLVVRCNRTARTISIARTGVPAATAALYIWTSSASRAVPARFETAQILTADLAATDPLLDAIAFTRGRFATSALGAPLIAVPGWPESERVIEDCRT